ncbi:MAG: M81 family metallopeptidase [Pseudomonadota bacterium]
MRVFIAGLCHESSTFSPIPTSRQSFIDFDHYRPIDGKIDETALVLNGYGRFAACAQAHGDEVFLSTYSFAQPSAPATKATYEGLRDEILNDLKAAGQFDAVLLFLHGAQMADGYDDCEGDLLSHVRGIVRTETFVGAVLDLHANVSDEMLEQADALVACRHYPHIDFNERAEHLYDIARHAIQSGTRPVMEFRRVPMLGMFYTTEPQMEKVNAQALALQQSDGVQSVSMIHGFAWADLPFIGAGVLVVRDADASDKADAIEELAQSFFSIRNETRSLRVDIGEALDQAEAYKNSGKTVVIADPCDNAGGGAPSDTMFIIREALDRGLTGYACGLVWDPVAVRMAFDLGEGARFPLRLGGKSGPASGEPLDVIGTVVAVRCNMSQLGIGYTHPIGDGALIEVAGNFIALSSVRGQVFSPTCFTDFDLDLGSLTGVIVKSSQHFYEQFAPLASKVLYCDTPGAMTLDFKADMFRRIPRPIWPIDPLENP